MEPNECPVCHEEIDNDDLYWACFVDGHNRDLENDNYEFGLNCSDCFTRLFVKASFETIVLEILPE